MSAVTGTRIPITIHFQSQERITLITIGFFIVSECMRALIVIPPTAAFIHATVSGVPNAGSVMIAGTAQIVLAVLTSAASST